MFKVGDKVVYPHHGAGTIVKKEKRIVLGEKREYLTIKILHNDMTVNVPCENAEAVGLRQVIDEEMVKKVTKALTGGGTAMPKNWNRRFKHNRDKMKTGDIFELAEVVRNLSLRDHEKGLSTGEKQMFVKAKKILASELMYAKSLDEEAAAEWLDEVLSTNGDNGATKKKTVGDGAEGHRVEVEEQGRRGGVTCRCGPFSRLRVAGSGSATIARRRSLGSATYRWSPSRCAGSTSPTGSTASSSRLLPDWEEPCIVLAEELGAGKVSTRRDRRRDARRVGARGARRGARGCRGRARPRCGAPARLGRVIGRVLAPLSEGYDGAVPVLRSRTR